MGKKKRLFYIFIATVLLTFLTCLFSVIFIKNLGPLIYSFGEEQFGEIFSQLKSSSTIIPPFILILLIYGLVLFLLFKKNSNKLILKIFVVVTITLFIQIISILLTMVNGIYLIDIIISLINNIGGLGL